MSCVSVWMKSGEVLILHGAECENDGNRVLFLSAHLQLADNEDRNNAERPVGNAGDGRVSVESVDDDDGVDTLALAASELFPEVTYRVTLEDEEEQEEDTVDLNGEEARPEDYAVNTVDGDSQQEDADTEFEKDTGDDVGWFTSPPPLIRNPVSQSSLDEFCCGPGSVRTYLHAIREIRIGDKMSLFGSAL